MSASIDPTLGIKGVWNAESFEVDGIEYFPAQAGLNLHIQPLFGLTDVGAECHCTDPEPVVAAQCFSGLPYRHYGEDATGLTDANETWIYL